MAQANGQVSRHVDGHVGRSGEQFAGQSGRRSGGRSGRRSGGHDGERSVGTLVKQGTEQLSTLVRQELKLAQAELTSKGKKAGRGGGMFGAAALLAFFGLAALITAAIVAVAIPLPLWAAALIIAGGLLLLAGLFALAGRHEVKSAVPPKPEEAVDSVRRDLETIKERAKR